MADIGRLVAVIDGDLSGLQRSLNTAKGQLNAASRTMTSAGKALSLGVTAPIMAIGTAAVSAGMSFQSSMNRVKAVSGATGDEFDALSSTAKELGRTTQYSASQAADAMGFLAMAGFDANEIVGAMPGTLQLAAAANLDLARSADIVSNILTGYGMEVEELAYINDVLVKTMTSTNVDLNMLGESFKYVGPVAKSAGLEFDEVAAAIGLMGNAGIQGTMSGTALRGAITRLLKPTKEVSDTMNRLGLNVTDTNGQLLPLNEIVRQLEASGADTADMMALFGQRAGPAMAALVSQGSDALVELTDTLRNSGGTAETIANVQMEGLRGAWLRLKSAWEGLMISIAEMGALDALASVADGLAVVLQKVGEAISGLPQPVQLSILAFAGFAAAIGPALFLMGTFAGQVANLLPLLVKVAPAAQGAGKGLLAMRTAAMGMAPILTGVAVAATAVWAANSLIESDGPKWAKALENIIDPQERLAFALEQTEGRINDLSVKELMLIQRLHEEAEASEVAAEFTEKKSKADIEAIGPVEDLAEENYNLADALGAVRSAVDEALAPLNELRNMPIQETVELDYAIQDVERDTRALERALREGAIPAGYDSEEAVLAQIEANNNLKQAYEDQRQAIKDNIDAQVDDLEKKTLLGDMVNDGLVPSYADWEQKLKDTTGELDAERIKIIGPDGVVDAMEQMEAQMNDLRTPVDVVLRSHGIDEILAKLREIVRLVASNAMDAARAAAGNISSYVSGTIYRHEGGPVMAGMPYIVKPDEEVFIPDVNGYVQPLGKNGISGVSVNVAGNVVIQDPRKDTGPIGDLGWSLVSALQSRGVTI